ncbi:low temperature requirement protein A [uncultured Propionibacterium sp.]|uniref:low temperature requirement protein A n=1 Tax=uncultured Propionibacterium sp. TaxID=218066 RepID=UPI002931C911|nr:low temperature requirement protein A [uncultured Propionibacterium sp.]
MSDADGSALEVAPDEEQEVTKLELFFDLVYVFAVSQLSGHLLEHLSWRGALETLVLLLAVFGMWAFTTYESTMVLSRHRRSQLVLLAVMVLGLVMNASIGEAFEDSPWTFVVPMLVIQYGRTLVTRSYDAYPALRNHRSAMLVWFTLSGIPWIGGAIAAPEHRLWWWLIAVGIDVLGMRTYHPVPGIDRSSLGEVGFDMAHQIERCRLFLIICLGEAILTTGSAMIRGLHHPLAIATGMLSMVVIMCIWALPFGWDSYIDRYVEGNRQERSPLASGALVTEGQQVLVIGQVALAVGAELAIDEPGEPLPIAATAVLFGGVALCTLTLWAFLANFTDKHIWVPLVTSAAACLVCGAVVVLAHAPGIAAMGLLSAVMLLTCWRYSRVITAL